MKNLPRLALVSIFSVFVGGCVVVPHSHSYSSRSSALSSEESCPPGHRWSDGRCHDQGKGHDPGKHDKHKGHH